MSVIQTRFGAEVGECRGEDEEGVHVVLGYFRGWCSQYAQGGGGYWGEG